MNVATTVGGIFKPSVNLVRVFNFLNFGSYKSVHDMRVPWTFGGDRKILQIKDASCLIMRVISDKDQISLASNIISLLFSTFVSSFQPSLSCFKA